MIVQSPEDFEKDQNLLIMGLDALKEVRILKRSNDELKKFLIRQLVIFERAFDSDESTFTKHEMQAYVDAARFLQHGSESAYIRRVIEAINKLPF